MNNIIVKLKGEGLLEEKRIKVFVKRYRDEDFLLGKIDYDNRIIK